MHYLFWLKHWKTLAREEQMVLCANLVSVGLCFGPWMVFSIGGSTFFYTAFSQEIFLLGLTFLALCLWKVLGFLSRFRRRKNIFTWQPNEWWPLFISGQQFWLVILMWSVLWKVQQTQLQAELRFAFWIVLLAQILALVAEWIRWNQGQKDKVQEFFRLTDKSDTTKETK